MFLKWTKKLQNKINKIIRHNNRLIKSNRKKNKLKTKIKQRQKDKFANYMKKAKFIYEKMKLMK
jgi:hypothetical protein